MRAEKTFAQGEKRVCSDIAVNDPKRRQGKERELAAARFINVQV